MTSEKSTEKIGYRDIFSQREYLKLLTSNVVNRFGDAVDSITFTWLTYALTGSASWSAIVFGLNQLPSILIQPLAAVWVEKANKKMIMAATDIIRGFIVMLLAVTYIINALSPWLLAILTISISTAEAFRIPAGTGIIPQIIDLKYYSFANGLNKSLTTVVELIGTGLSGVILAVFGIPMAIGIDMISYFISALMILFIHPIETGPEPAAEIRPEGEKKSAFFTWWDNYKMTFKEGLSYIKKHRVIINFCILGITANGMLVPLNALLTPVIRQVWGQGAPLLSGFSLALTAGCGIGGFVYPYIAKKLKPRTIIILGGMILSFNYAFLSFGDFLPSVAAIVYVMVCAIAFFMGVGVALVSSCYGVQLVQCIEKDFLARITGLVNAFASASMPILSFIISFLALYLPVAVILLIGAAAGILIFFIIGIKKVDFEE